MVTVSFPRDFCGRVQHKTGAGSAIFSEAITRRLSTFANEKSYIGEWQKPRGRALATLATKNNQAPPERETDDEIVVETVNGTIKFAYTDEPEVTGWQRFSSWFGATIKQEAYSVRSG